ncbi:uncharacterized protein PHACADRAFT_179803 [Phanerochaete carnosa HHB-10118-sp]|uniref:F-box domain-containing protein n=1 Tax=Phanerochaete carnosa (strain HHB-10118-sp) TaxID=650164 RepID=K5VCA6_PHACS|nr:uncharacterized protein PHACADRAFT_179803 [Phanerochaete carnosa HHB-10118-sp]EKM60561.1 hypothetical protein PHACADRAFT_179803 [Phanerochaete carnosa HHB-10118-sp]
MVQLHDLPVELCARILCLLPVLDVVRFQRVRIILIMESCAAVSSSFCGLIRDSAELQYKIERFLTGAVDGSPASGYSFQNKTDRLKSWRQTWKRPSWNEERSLPSFTPVVCVSGPVFAQGMSEDELDTAIEFYTLGAKLRGVEPRSWTLNSLHEYYTFNFDWYQDLLVLCERYRRLNLVQDNHLTLLSSVESSRVTLRFLRCTTGQVHPAAKHVTLFATLPMEGVEGAAVVYLCGDIVLLRYNFSNGKPEFWVFDWRQGSLLLNFGVDTDVDGAEIVVQDCALLDSRYVMITASGTSSGHVLAVFDCYSVSCPARLLFPDAMRRHASLILELPLPVKPYSSNTFAMLDCQPDSPVALPAQLEGVAFRAAGPPIVLVTIWTNDGGDHTIQHSLFLPGRLILSRLVQSGARTVAPPLAHTIPWKAYAKECRLFHTSDMEVTSVYGSRYVTSGRVRRNEGSVQNPQEDQLVDILRIYHFGEPAAILHDTDVDGPAADDGTAKSSVTRVLEESDQSCSIIWAEQMQTGAPYLLTQINLGLGNAIGSGMWLVEDGVVLTEGSAGYAA